MSVPGPVLGPCDPWIDGADLAACCDVAEGSGVKASLDVVFEGGTNTDMRLVALEPGEDGNLITIQIDRGAGGTAETTAVLTGTHIVVTTSADGGGANTATANDVIVAVQAEAEELVTIAAINGNGEGVLPNQKFIVPETPLAGGGPDPLLDVMALEASMALFEISGRQFTGLCGPVTVRPCRGSCGCWGSAAAGPWYWSSAPYGFGWAWGWRNECGDRCGCEPMSRVKLAGYPVREIVEVKIDGVVVDPASYRLDRWRYLTRMDDPGPPVVRRHWPSCQNMSLEDDQPGTFSVSYRYGVDPPQLGRDAAAELGCQLYLQCADSDSCLLPEGTTKVDREGITIERGLLANWFDPTKPTGLPRLDTFLKAYWATRGRRRPMTFSPDVPPFPLRMT
ncbi:MAG: hypothetical protein ACJ79H_04405 [Myxococcales bacterium]